MWLKLLCSDRVWRQIFDGNVRVRGIGRQRGRKLSSQHLDGRHALLPIDDYAAPGVHIERPDSEASLVQKADPDRHTPDRAFTHHQIGGASAASMVLTSMSRKRFTSLPRLFAGNFQGDELANFKRAFSGMR